MILFGESRIITSGHWRRIAGVVPLPPVSTQLAIGYASENTTSKYHRFFDSLMKMCLYFALACCARVLLAMHWASAPEGFLLFMPPVDPFDPDKLLPELLLFRINLDIPAFVRVAVRNEMNRDEILVYLHLITNTPSATEKMWRFTLVAQDKALKLGMRFWYGCTSRMAVWSIRNISAGNYASRCTLRRRYLRHLRIKGLFGTERWFEAAHATLVIRCGRGKLLLFFLLFCRIMHVFCSETAVFNAQLGEGLDLTG